MPSRELHQIPQIAVQILEHRHPTIIVGRRRPRPLDPGGSEGGMVAIEIVGRQEQEHPPAGLVSDIARLMLGRGAREQDGGGTGRRTGRADRHPALVLFGLVGVFDQREAELADIESKCFVIVADDQGEMGEMRHRLGDAKFSSDCHNPQIYEHSRYNRLRRRQDSYQDRSNLAPAS